MLRNEKRKGHGDLAYMAGRMVEQIFEEWEQTTLLQASVKVNAEEALVEAVE